MGPLGSSPSVAIWPNGKRNPAGQQDLFWKGSGNNGLWEAIWNNGWHGPTAVPNVNNVASAPTAIINAPQDSEQIFWKGTNNQLWEMVWAGHWSGPFQIGTGPLG